MEKIYNAKDEYISRIAVHMVEQYVEGLLSATTLEGLIWQELRLEAWDEQEEEDSVRRTCTRIAQRICSRVLYAAWRSSNLYVRECVFANMRCYLEKVLRRSSHIEQWPHTSHSLEDVLHQTMEILCKLGRRDSGGPDDPDRFLKWTQTIAVRQAYAFAEHTEHDNVLSLDENSELFVNQFVEKSEPLNEVLLQELRNTLTLALLTLRNPQYQQVLFYTYFLELDGPEVAEKMGVLVQEVYTWRRRALMALRRQPEIIQLLRSLHE
jgi:RNA polymerase sigma factor (sigma-70 family)